MEEKLENLYANLKGNQDVYPEGLADVVEQYKINHF